jgi:hypothetical protein
MLLPSKVLLLWGSRLTALCVVRPLCEDDGPLMHVVFPIDQEKFEWPNPGDRAHVLALQLSKAGGLFAWSSGNAGALVCTDVATAQTCYSTSPSTPNFTCLSC